MKVKQTTTIILTSYALFTLLPQKKKLKFNDSIRHDRKPNFSIIFDIKREDTIASLFKVSPFGAGCKSGCEWGC